MESINNEDQMWIYIYIYMCVNIHTYEHVINDICGRKDKLWNSLV